MDGLIELVFDGVPDGAVHGLVRDLLQEAKVFDLSHSELGSLDPKRLGQDLMPLLKQETSSASIFIRAASAMIGRVLIQTPLVRILRFGGSNEVAVVFDRNDIDLAGRKDAANKLSAGASYLASTAAVSEYYCGFEPATDAQTRLFSNEKIGPLIEI